MSGSHVVNVFGFHVEINNIHFLKLRNKKKQQFIDTLVNK